MKTLKVRVRVKFRAFGITFGQLDETRTVLDIPFEVASLIQALLAKPLFDDRGVYVALFLA